MEENGKGERSPVGEAGVYRRGGGGAAERYLIRRCNSRAVYIPCAGGYNLLT